MKKTFMIIMVSVLSTGMLLTACGPRVKKAESSRAAVEIAKNIQGKLSGRVNYLLQQGQAFYDAKDYRGAIDITQYILWHMDRNSKEAQDMLVKAKQSLTDEIMAKRDALLVKQKAARKAQEAQKAQAKAAKLTTTAQKPAAESTSPATTK
ncbi:MAG: hypothetical protein HQ579_07260 [Candidatus Omnitrophica bacterium]|nr:hypothetical protein [Candidatus Omnitrophota bacterium]